MPRIKNAANYLIALALIICINFFLPRLAPGDPISAIFGQCACTEIPPDQKAALIKRFALDQSMWKQFVAYITTLAGGDFGYSYRYSSPVIKLVLGSLPWTLFLVGASVVISALGGVILGIESGWRRGKKTDKFLLSGVMFLNGLPDFFIGIVLLLIFGVVLGISPLAGGMTPYAELSGVALYWDILKHSFLPLATLIIVNLTGAYILTRNTMVTVLGEPYILTARAKGLPDRSIRYRHAGKNSVLPVITRTGIQVGRLFTGALFVEIVFSYPGMGFLAYKALDARDYPLLQAILVVVALCVIVTNLLVDVFYKKIDPRVN